MDPRVARERKRDGENVTDFAHRIERKMKDAVRPANVKGVDVADDR